MVFGTPLQHTDAVLRPVVWWRKPLRRFSFFSGSGVSFPTMKPRVFYITLQSLLYYVSKGNGRPMWLPGSAKMKCVKHTVRYSVGGWLLFNIIQEVPVARGVTSRGALLLRGGNLFCAETSREDAERACGLSSVPSPL